MLDSQTKIIRHRKRKIQPTVEKKKKSVTETDLEMTQMLKFTEKDIKTVLITAFKEMFMLKKKKKKKTKKGLV